MVEKDFSHGTLQYSTMGQDIFHLDVFFSAIVMLGLALSFSHFTAVIAPTGNVVPSA